MRWHDDEKKAAQDWKFIVRVNPGFDTPKDSESNRNYSDYNWLNSHIFNCYTIPSGGTYKFCRWWWHGCCGVCNDGNLEFLNWVEND